MAMRTTVHNGRTNSSGKVFSNKHNDRNFDVSKTPHIKQDKIIHNIIINCYNNNSLTFEQVEKKYYEETFSKALEITNNNYIKNGHKEKCKTVDKLLKSPRYCPEETIIQIGDKNHSVSPQLLTKCFNSFMNKYIKFNEEHGKPFKILNIALHADEKVPHIQIRKVWQYEDNGIMHVNQNKALEKANIPLPDPTKPEGRYNNRKMVFDEIIREMWLDTCQENHIVINDVPIPDRKGLDLEDYIKMKNKEILDNPDFMIQTIVKENRTLKKQNEKLKEQIQMQKEILKQNNISVPHEYKKHEYKKTK